MDGGKIDVNITFDENNQIRVLAADKYRETENLKGECIDFLKKIMSFNDMVSTLTEVLDAQAQKIEDAKLRAVGSRNKVEGEEDNRRKREQELRTLINEKKMMLERLNYQYESLQKVANEQKLTIEKLSNNEI
jgi:intraflagellar transport protein 20